MKESVKKWFKYIDDDLDTVAQISHSELLTNISAFHSQQAIEKLFKTVLVENNQEIPKIHNLIKLYNLANKFLNIELDRDKLKTLDSLYITSRYPMEFGLLPDGKPTIEEAKEFYEFALNIYEQVKNILEK